MTSSICGTNEVVLVDIFDNERGSMPKLLAHLQGELHRAFSVFLYYGDKLLLQQRSFKKYHSGGLWCNTCCSHQRMGEPTVKSATRRLLEETGLECSLYEAFSFVYRANVGNGLFEYEFDHVLIGECNKELIPSFDNDEIERMAWVDIDELSHDLLSCPEKYAPWFIIAAPKVIALIKHC